MLLDDFVDLPRHGGFEQRMAALRAEERRNVLKAVKLFPPRLCMCDRLPLQATATFGAFFRLLFHSHCFFRVHGSVQTVGSYQWTVMMYAFVPSNAQET